MPFVLVIGVLGEDKHVPAMNDLGSRWQSGYRKTGLVPAWAYLILGYEGQYE